MVQKIVKKAIVVETVRTFKQSMLSLSFNLGGILAGTLLALYLDIFSLTPWTLIIYPGILSIRGTIGGLFSGRLSTGLHLGTVRTCFYGNTRNFYLLWQEIIVLTLESSVVMGLGASLFSVFLLRITALDFIAILSIIIATMGISLVFISPITVAISFLSFKSGLDPDVIVYPIEATVADILVTVSYIMVLNTFFPLSRSGYYLTGLLDLVFLCFVLYILFRDTKERSFAKTIEETLLTLLLVTFVVNVTGSLLGEISEVAGRRREIYVMYPAIINNIGSVGSIVGSTATTKLALGTIKPSFTSIKYHLTEIVGGWMASLTMFTLFSVISFFIQPMFSINELLRFIKLFYTTNFPAVLSIVIIAYVVAIVTYRRGFDPDNFVIPIESSLADAVTTFSLFIAIQTIG